MNQQHTSKFVNHFTLLLCFLLQCCDNKTNDDSYWSNEHEKTELEAKLNLLSYRYASQTQHLQEDLQPPSPSQLSPTQLKKILTTQKEHLLNEIASLETEISNFNNNRLLTARAQSIGKTFSSIKLNNGREYENAWIVKIVDAGVSIRHQFGAATLRYDDLSPAQRDEFGMDQAKSIAAEKQLNQQQADFDKWINAEMLAIAKNRADRSIQDANHNKNALPLRTTSINHFNLNPICKPLASGPTPFGSGSIWKNHLDHHSYYSYRRYTNYTPSIHYYRPPAHTLSNP